MAMQTTVEQGSKQAHAGSYSARDMAVLEGLEPQSQLGAGERRNAATAA